MTSQVLAGGRRRADIAVYREVSLTRNVEHGRFVFPRGARGVVVHRHSDGIGYEVEFEHPKQWVLTLTASDIEEI